MLRRKVFDSLMEWKHRPGHDPLLLRGQKQVGKTYILKEFAKTYEGSAYVDLSKDRPMIDFFRKGPTVDELVQVIQLNDPSSNLSEGCLIILDEVQTCPEARSMLKEFSMDGRYDVIATGSLLDVRLNNLENSYDALIPVGYEEHMRMYSLDFEEFLWAKGYRPDVIDVVKTAIRQREPLSQPILDRFDSLFREFMLIGGMPEVVSDHVEGRGIVQVQRDLDKILESMRSDITRYSEPSETLKILRCMDSIPSQLSETNKRFTYSRLNNGGSRDGIRKYGGALDWIGKSGMGNICYRAGGISRPIRNEMDLDVFKVYVSDTGMLVRMMDGPSNAASLALTIDDPGFNKGALMENVVAECLMKSGYERLYYIKRNGKDMMELDFITDLGSEVVAIEVKSGRTRVAKSLVKSLDNDTIDRRVMFERSNIHVDGSGIEHYPLFAAAFISEMESHREQPYIDGHRVTDEEQDALLRGS